MKTVLWTIFLLLCAGAQGQTQFGRAAANNTLQQLAELTGTQKDQLVASGVAIGGNTLVIGAPVASGSDI